jgi:HSP20 family protein
MLVRYWNPWREIETVRRQLDRPFEGLTSQAKTELAWTPAVELQDNGETLALRVQLPGMNLSDIDVKVTREAVAITAEHHQQNTEHNGYYRSEFRYGQFRRIVPLPVAIENDKVQAEYKDGVLNLTLPKTAEARNQVVKLNLADLIPATPEQKSEADNN